MVRATKVAVWALVVSVGAGCGGQKAEAPAVAPPAQVAAPAVAPPEEAPAEADTAAPEAPKYTPEAAESLVKQMASCEYDFDCAAYEPLVAFGPAAGPQLLALAMDEGKAAKARGVAVLALGASGSKVDVAALYASVKKADDYSLSSAFDKVVGTLAAGDDAFRDAARAEYVGAEDAMAARHVLQALPGSLDWALTQLEGEHPPELDVRFADLVGDLATAAELPRIQALLDGDRVKDAMARHRLAAEAIALGDTSRYGVLLAGLASRDVYERADAANFFAKVAKGVPPAEKDKAIKLLKAGLAKDPGGLTATGYQQSLEALGAK